MLVAEGETGLSSEERGWGGGSVAREENPKRCCAKGWRKLQSLRRHLPNAVRWMQVATPAVFEATNTTPPPPAYSCRVPKK